MRHARTDSPRLPWYARISACPRPWTHVYARYLVGSSRARADAGRRARAQDLRAEIHHQPHAETRGAVRVVRARDVVLQLPERQLVGLRVAAPDLVHEDVAASLQRTADCAHAPVDPRQLARRIARGIDVGQQQPHIAAVLRLSEVDLRALPEPRPLRRAPLRRRTGTSAATTTATSSARFTRARSPPPGPLSRRGAARRRARSHARRMRCPPRGRAARTCAR